MRARSSIGAVVVLAMLSGCTSYQQSKKVALVGAGIASLGLLLADPLGAALSMDTFDHNRAILLGLVVVAPGAVVSLGGLFGMAAWAPWDGPRAKPERHAAQAAAARARAEAARERAWALTKNSATAARAGDCTKVVSVGSDVLALDHEFHATVFMRDVAIKRCVDAGTAPPAPPVTPQAATQGATQDPGALFPPVVQPAPPVTPPAGSP